MKKLGILLGLITMVYTVISAGIITDPVGNKAVGEKLTATEFNNLKNSILNTVNGDIDAANIENGAVNTDELKDDSVTPAKVDDDNTSPFVMSGISVTSGTVTTIYTSTVTVGTAISVPAGSLQGADIEANGITSTQLADEISVATMTATTSISLPNNSVTSTFLADDITVSTITVSTDATIAKHMKRIYYTTLTSSATSVDITCNGKNYYYIVLDIVCAQNAETVYGLRYNNRGDAGDYFYVYDYFTIATKAEGITNNTWFSIGRSTSSTSEFSHMEAVCTIISARNSIVGEHGSNRGYPFLSSTYVGSSYGSAAIYTGGDYMGMCTDNAARDEVLTTLTILGNQTNGMGIGTYIEVWEEQ